MDWSQHSSESVVPVAQRVRIRRIGSPVRGFWINGQAPALGEAIETDRGIAEGLIAQGKAEYAT